MDSANTIKLKDSAIAVAVAALSIVALVFVYRSASDKSELTRLREQNVVLTQQLKKLDQQFRRIRQYTKSTGALATMDVRQSDSRMSSELTDQRSEPLTGVFGRVALAAKKLPSAGEVPGDLEGFTRTLTLVDALNRDADVVVRRLTSLATILKYNKEITRQIPSMMPTEGRIASEFGIRLDPFEGKRHMHAGVDIVAEMGSEVRAPADGTVTFVGQFDTLGQAIVLSHGESHVLTRYGHLSRYRVKLGDKVRRGQIIANTGNSGHSTGPHLHYEVWVKNTAVNPRDFFFDMTDTNALVADGDGMLKEPTSVAANGMEDQ